MCIYIYSYTIINIYVNKRRFSPVCHLEIGRARCQDIVCFRTLEAVSPASHFPWPASSFFTRHLAPRAPLRARARAHLPWQWTLSCFAPVSNSTSCHLYCLQCAAKVQLFSPCTPPRARARIYLDNGLCRVLRPYLIQPLVTYIAYSVQLKYNSFPHAPLRARARAHLPCQ